MLRLALALMFAGCGGGPTPAPDGAAAPAQGGVGTSPDLPNPCLANPCEATLIDPAVNPCIEAPPPSAP